MKIQKIVLFLLFYSVVAWTAELQTNSTYSADSPSWINKSRIDRVTERIQNFMEWDIRRVTVIWFKDQASFEKAHGLGATVLAVSRKNDNSVLIGPKVTSENFDAVFGHELVHVISFQKYKQAIPKWLEEGLANYVAKAGQVNYRWLASQPFPADVRDLIHPFDGSSDHIRYHYQASQALTEMIAAKCDLRNLLRLSVGMKMDNYLDTYCQIKDLNADYRKWIQKQSGK